MGEQPPTDLPGDPEGDRLSLAPELESCQSYLVRWTSMVDKEVSFFGISFRASGNWQMAQFQYDDGNPAPEAQNLSFVQSNLTGTFQNILFSGGGTEYPDFIIDDLEVIATCSSVPVVPSTWSRLKARY